MADKVTNPILATPLILDQIGDVQRYLTDLIQSLTGALQSLVTRSNLALINDGSEAASAPVMLKTYVKAALPSAAKYKNGMIIVSDDVGGLTPAFSDGTNWRRDADRAVIS